MKEREYSVYLHENVFNKKKYFGLTKQHPVEARWGANGCNYLESPHFYEAIKKYGWNNFSHIIIAENLTKEEACWLEKYLIKTYKTQNKEFGYNILEGGTAPSLPKETRDKISKAMMGNKNGLGHPCSEEKKKKISEAQKGRKFTEEHKKKISEAKKGKSTCPCSEEKRQKIIAAKKDKKKVYCEEIQIVYDSVQECGRQLGLTATNISAVCRGKHKHHHGYHFKFYDDIIKA